MRRRIVAGNWKLHGDRRFALELVGAIAGQPALRRALTDPSTPDEARAGLATALFGSRVGADATAVAAEAARAIGLGFLPAARHVILPQALRGAITPLGNTVIALTKNTTVAAAASVAEASGLMKRMIEFSPDVMVAIFLTFAIGFCLIVIPIGLLTTWASEKWAVAR